MSSKPLELHSLCSIFPEMDEETFGGLTASMQEDGFKKNNPIIMFEGKILDGRNRHNAAIAAGRKPIFEQFKGTENDAREFVIRQNLTRRHLTASQRASIAAELSEELGESIATAAKKLGVSKDSVAVAKKIKKKAPEVAKEVKSGKKSLNKAEREVAPSSKKSTSKNVTLDNISDMYGSATPPAEKPKVEAKEPAKSDAQVAYEAYYDMTGAKDIPGFEGLPSKEIAAWKAAASAVLENQ